MWRWLMNRLPDWNSDWMLEPGSMTELWSLAVSLLVFAFTLWIARRQIQIMHRQTLMMQEQGELAQTQTKLATKQAEIVEKQLAVKPDLRLATSRHYYRINPETMALERAEIGFVVRNYGQKSAEGYQWDLKHSPAGSGATFMPFLNSQVHLTRDDWTFWVAGHSTMKIFAGAPVEFGSLFLNPVNGVLPEVVTLQITLSWDGGRWPVAEGGHVTWELRRSGNQYRILTDVDADTQPEDERE